MTSTMRKRRVVVFAFACLLCFLCIGISVLRAQEEDRPRERSGEEGRFKDQSAAVVTFEPQMFAADSGLVRVDILYRGRFDFFVFTRDFSADAPLYRAHGELLIELIDSTDASISRKVQAMSLNAPDNESTHLRLNYYQGTASFVVHPGRFTSVYHIEDKESRREFEDRKQVLRVLPFRPEAMVRSTVLFVQPSNQPPAQRNFTALNDNNATEFSRNTGALVTVKDESTPASVRYSITQIFPEGRDRSTAQEETTTTATVFHHSLLRLDPSAADNAGYVLDSNAATSTIYFLLPTSRLKQGRYVLLLHLAAGDTASIRKEFTVHWNNMPLSLYDLDFAVTAMRYITTDSDTTIFAAGARKRGLGNLKNSGKSGIPFQGLRLMK